MKKMYCLFLWLTVAGCDTNERDESTVREISHDNGLAAEAEFEYTSMDRIDNGFVFHRNAEGSRQTDSITLELIRAYDTSNTETRTIGDVAYHFHLNTIYDENGDVSIFGVLVGVWNH